MGKGSNNIGNQLRAVKNKYVRRHGGVLEGGLSGQFRAQELAGACVVIDWRVKLKLGCDYRLRVSL